MMTNELKDFPMTLVEFVQIRKPDLRTKLKLALDVANQIVSFIKKGHKRYNNVFASKVIVDSSPETEFHYEAYLPSMDADTSLSDEVKRIYDRSFAQTSSIYAPEQFIILRNYSKFTATFAFGSLLYFLLTSKDVNDVTPTSVPENYSTCERNQNARHLPVADAGHLGACRWVNFIEDKINLRGSTYGTTTARDPRHQPIPFNTPDALKKLITGTWNYNPLRRPSFEGEIIPLLNKIIESLPSGFDLSQINELYAIDSVLKELGLEIYAEKFKQEDIEMDIFVDLTREDLVELEVTVGHRKKIMKKIAELRQAQLFT